MLSSINGSTLVSLVACWQLLLLWYIEIIWSDCKFFHICLWIYILYALIHIINRTIFMVKMILRLAKVLKFIKAILFIGNCFTNYLATLRRRLHLILINLLRLLLILCVFLLLLILSVFTLLLVLILIALKVFAISIILLIGIWIRIWWVYLRLEVVMIRSSITVLATMWPHLQWSFFVLKAKLFFRLL